MEQLIISISAEADLQEILIAELNLIGYDGFQQEESSLKSFVTQDKFDEAALLALLERYQISPAVFEKEVLENKNWNEVWESNFEEVSIGDKLLIRAPFHEPKEGFLHEIVIMPKMSFGTGHHQTTSMMCKALFDIQPQGKAVLDMGSGTGILAILAHKLGAANCVAIDYDEWAYNNCLENIEVNNCPEIEVLQGSKEAVSGTFDLILANINRNILIDQIDTYFNHLNKGGILVMSGFYETDLPLILTKTENLALSPLKRYQEDDWVAHSFGKELSSF